MSPFLTPARLGRLAFVTLLSLLASGCGFVIIGGVGALFGSQGGSNRSSVVIIATAEGVDLVLSRGPKDLGDTTEGKGESVVAGQLRLAVTSDATLQTVVLTARGTGDDSRIPTVRLFHDLDSDGLLGAGDLQIGTTQTFSGNDGQATFGTLGFGLQSGTPVDVIAVLELPPNAADGDTFQVELSDSNALVATTLVAGEAQQIQLFGAPVSGGLRTISSTGTLTLSLGVNTPQAKGVFPNAADVEIVQIGLQASSVENIRIDSIRFTAGGSANDATDLTQAELFLDVDSDGQLNRAIDAPLGTVSAPASDNGVLNFTGLGATIQKSSILRWLLVYQLNGAASDGQTFRADLIASSDVTGVGLNSAQPPVLSGPPIQGGATFTVQRARLDVTVGPFNPTRAATPGTGGIAVLQARVAASGVEPVVVSTFGVSGSGAGNESTDLAAVRLYHDLDGDGELDAGEPLIAGPATFAADDGQALLSGFSRELTPGASELWLVTYDLAAGAVGGDTFTAATAGAGTVSVSGRTSGLPLIPTVPALSGGLLQTRGSLSATLGATQPGVPNQALSNSANAVAVQLVVGAGAGESVRPTALTVTPGGTGHDQLAVTAVDLIEDVDLSGTFTGGDTLIQSQAYPGDNLSLTFSAAGGLLAGDIAPLTSRTLLLRYRFAGQATQGQSFALQIPTTSWTASGVASGVQIPVSGATLSTSGNPLVAQRAQLTFSLGPQNPNASDVLNGATNVPVLQLVANAGPGENVQLGALTFRSSGTANETSVIQQARLYLEGAGPLGVVDGTDLQLGAGLGYSGDNGFVAFSAAPLTTIAAGTSATLLLAYDILPGALAGGSFTARLDAAGDVGSTGVSTTLTGSTLGTPQTGQPKSVQRGSLSVVVGAQNPVAANSFPNRTGVRMLHATLTAGTAESVRVTSVRLTAAGSADESTAVGGLDLYLDLNGDGLVSPGDTLLGSAGAVGDDAAVTISGLTLDVPPGQSRSLLATFDVAAAATPGTNLRLRLPAPSLDFVAVGLTSAQAITPSGAAVEGNPISLVLGALTLTAPGSNPGSSTELNTGQGVEMLQIRCAANATESVRVSTVAIEHLGTGNAVAHIGTASLYLDSNANGILDADTLLSTTTFTGTTATFTIVAGTFDVAASATADLLVAYDFNGAAPAGVTFQARLVSNANLAAAGNASGLTVPVSGAPLQGGVKTLNVPSLTLALGAGSPVAGDTLRNQQSLVAFQATLSAGGAEPIRASSLRVSATGTIDLSTQVSRIRLYRENDPPNGVLDGDVLIGDRVGGFTGGAHTFALGTNDLEVPAGGSKAVLVVLDLNAPVGSAGNTVSISLAANGDLVAIGVVSGQAVTPSGAPANGAARTVREASLSLSNGPNTPGAADVAKVSSGTAVHQVRLSAGAAEAVRVTSLRFDVQGPTPQTAVTLARLYRDDNNNGVLDGDVLLGSGTLGAGNDITFAPSAGSLDIASVGSRDVLLVLDFGGTASEGNAFTARIPGNGDVVAQGLTSSLGVTPSGAPLSGSAFTTRETVLTAAIGTAPPAATVFNNAAGVSALHLSFQAGPADGVRLTQLVLRASGTANDAGATVHLYADTNGNGTLEAGELLVQSRSIAGDNGTATFAFLPTQVVIPASQTRFYLARLDLPGTATAGQTHALRLQAGTDLTGTSVSVGAAVDFQGAYPLQGPDLTAQTTSLTLVSPSTQVLAGNLFPNANQATVLKVELSAGALEGVRATQLVFRPTGASTGNETAATVRLYRDANSNGTLEPAADTLIQTQTGNNTAITFLNAGGLIDVPASGTELLLVSYSLGAPTPAAGDVFQLGLAAADVTALGLSSAGPVAPTGGPVTAGVQTIVTGALVISNGPAAPSAAQVFGGQTRTLHQVRLAATTEAIRVDTFRVQHSGSGDPAADLTQVRLYRDDNSNGVLDGDTLLQAGAFVGTTATFTQVGGLTTVAVGSPVDLLVVSTYGITASTGETFAAQGTVPADLVAVGVSSTVTLTPTGSSAAGANHTFLAGALSLAVGASPPTSGPAFANQSDVAIQQILVTATGEGATLQNLAVEATGTGAPTAISAVKLWEDKNLDGRVDAGDAFLATTTFTGSTATFAGSVATVNTSAALTLLVSFDFNATGSNGQTFGVDALVPGDLSAQGTQSTLAITPTGSAPASALKTLSVGSLALQVGPAQPPVGSVVPGATRVAIQQVRLNASGEPSRLETLSLGFAGSGLPAQVVQAELYHDQDSDGVVSAADTLLVSQTFTGTTAVFSKAGGLATISTATAVDLLVSYDLSGLVVAGQTFGADALTAGELSATGTLSGSAITPTGSAPASNLKTVISLGTLTLAAGSTPPVAGATFINQTNVAIQQLRLTATAESARITSFTITLAGSGASSSLVQARLYHDQNADGQIDGGDIQLDTATFTGNEASFSQASGLIVVTTALPVELLVAYDFNGAGTVAQTFGLASIASTDLLATGLTTAAALTPTGSVTTSSLKTLSVGALVLTTGTNNPGPATAGPGQLSVVAQQFTLGASVEAARLDSLVVTRAGAGIDGAVSQVRLYRDDNTNGLLDGDTILASGTFAGGNVTLGAGNLLTVNSGSSVHLLVVLDFTGATLGQTYGADAVSPVDVTAVGVSSGAALVPTGTGNPGGLITIAALPAVALASTPLTASPVYPTQKDVVAAQIQLSESSGNPAELHQLQVRASGSAADQNAVAFLRLYRNNAPIASTLGPEDTLIGLTTYFADNGLAAFAALNETIPASGTLELLVTYELGNAASMAVGQTLIATVEPTGLSVTGTGGTPSVTVTGIAQVGPTLTTGGVVRVRRGPVSPTGNVAVRANTPATEVLQLELRSEFFPSTLSSLAIDASGGGNDVAGINSASLFRDVNSDGLLDGGDVLLLSLASPYGADDGTATFGGLSEVLAGGTTTHLLVVYGIAAPPANADFTLTVDATSDLTTTGVVESEPTFPAQGAVVRVYGGVTVALAPGDPTTAPTSPGTNQAVMQVSLSADPTEAMTLTGIAVTASGTLVDNTDVSAAKLYTDDGDDLFEPGGDDIQLGSTLTFPSDDGIATFGGLSSAIAGGATLKLWVALDFTGGAGSTFEPVLASDAVAVTAAVTTSTLVTGVPLQGGVQTVALVAAPALFSEVSPRPNLFTTSTTRTDVAVGDMNQDGKPDLVVLGGNLSVEVLLGDGLGNFSPKVERALTGPPAGTASRIHLADINGDTYPDVLVTTSTDFHSLLNQGSGDPGNLAATSTSLYVGASSTLGEIRSVDYDRDGDLDLLVSEEVVVLRGVHKFTNDGSGTLSDGGFESVPFDPISGFIESADMNRDGIEDLFATGSGRLILQLGSGVPGYAAEDDDATGSTPQDLAVGDVDHDGFLDVVTIRLSDDWRSFRGSAGPGAATLDTDTTSSTAATTSLTLARGLLMGDYDRDGKLDLAIAHVGVDGVVAHPSGGSLSFPSALASGTSLPVNADADRIAQGDFDLDGDLDLVLVSSTQSNRDAYLLFGNRTPDGVAPVASTSTTWTARTPNRVAVGDFNKDGRLDYVLTDSTNSRVGVFLQAGGGFTNPFDSDSGDQNPDDVVVGDVNRDGNLDFVVGLDGPGSDGVNLYLGDGTGGFTVSNFEGPSFNTVRDLALGDLNGDGVLDVVAISATGDLQVIRGNGTDFDTPAGADKFSISNQPVTVKLGDFNQDGNLDVVVSHVFPRRITFLPGNGDYSFGAASTFAPDAAVADLGPLAVGDINRDGSLDLVVGSNTAAFVEVFAGDGAGGFTSQGTRAATIGIELGLADLDRDGDLDLILARPSMGAVVTLELTGSATFTYAAPQTLVLGGAGNAFGMALGDFDRDGDVDAVVARATRAIIVEGQ